MVFLVRTLLTLLAALPLRVAHALGALLGRLTYLVSPTYRRHLQENMQQAGVAPALRSAAIAEAGKQALELPSILLRPAEEILPRIVKVTGWDVVEQAWQAGKGIVFLTPHLGCFEITAQYYASHAPITVLYRPPKRAFLQALIEKGRRRKNVHLAPADLSGVRSLIKALKRGEAVGLLPDQAPKMGEGVWLDFFGKPAYTMTLAARLTETGAATIFAWAERLPDGLGYHFHLRSAHHELTGVTVDRAKQINFEIESLIRQRPEQYLWGYNRYKRPGGAPPSEQMA
ncbi:MAG: lysophospholipid acyltransferase family protein [Rhodocyclaceae bacterium]|nr:lysophospholipid acyltransferase family protein [Rhodocyclaceae bacterium]